MQLKIKPFKPKRLKGFSLVELLVVVAIIGVLAAVGIVGYSNYMENTKLRVLQSNAEAVASALKTFAQTAETGEGCNNWQSCYNYVESQIWRNPYDSAQEHTVYFGLYCGPAGPDPTVKQRGSIIVDKVGSEVSVGYCDATDNYQIIATFNYE